MSDPNDPDRNNTFDARYLAFLETVAQLRPRLHRYCSRMTGSTLDGEDLVQDTLFEAYRKLDQFDSTRAFTPWIFRIAHNRCIDFLRRRRLKFDVESAAAQPDSVEPAEPTGQAVGRALEQVILTLPPRERASLLLKDIFDYSLEEIAEMTGATVGAVKAALNRGRSKVSALRTKSRVVETRASAARSLTSQQRQILQLYIERFNRRDWDGVRELIRADAGVMVADKFTGLVGHAPYFANYQRWTAPWRLMPGSVDDEPVAIVQTRIEGHWSVSGIVRVAFAEDRIAGIVDYSHCPWILQSAGIVVFAPAS